MCILYIVAIHLHLFYHRLRLALYYSHSLANIIRHEASFIALMVSVRIY